LLRDVASEERYVAARSSLPETSSEVAIPRSKAGPLPFVV
jgi:hypothetical protein